MRVLVPLQQEAPPAGARSFRVFSSFFLQPLALPKLQLLLLFLCPCKLRLDRLNFSVGIARIDLAYAHLLLHEVLVNSILFLNLPLHFLELIEQILLLAGRHGDELTCLGQEHLER